jgi:hypothetical protein
MHGAPEPEDCCVIVRVRVANAEQSEVSHPFHSLHALNAQSASSTSPYFTSAAITDIHVETRIAKTIQNKRTLSGALLNGFITSGRGSIFSKPKDISFQMDRGRNLYLHTQCVQQCQAFANLLNYLV